MSWIDEIIERISVSRQQKRIGREMSNYAVNAKQATIGIGRTPTLDSDKGIRFQVYKATGGVVVETTMYDNHKDRHYHGLYIITDEQDLGKEIGKIITMETLKL